MRRSVLGLCRNADGAVAPIVALSLFGLIAAGGLAFDYARLAGMDSELQAAADQAALAAATQLDGTSDARARATAAAKSLLRNTTLFANDAGDANDPKRAAIATVTFYESYDDATDTYGDEATTDQDAKVARVYAAGRTANYALTPITGALHSDAIEAQAAASIGASSICKVPPMMICMPNGGAAFPTAADIGKGVLLEPGPKVGAWVPGNYGYLDFGNGASGLKTNLGANNDDSGCVDNTNGTPTEPGNNTSVTDALNTRFDIYGPSLACDQATGNNCPAENTRKDFVQMIEQTITKSSTAPAPTQADRATCVPSTDKKEAFRYDSLAKGFPRDTCHLPGGSCTTNKFGNGVWDMTGYFSQNHPGVNKSVVGASTRYATYLWELADKANRLSPILVNPSATWSAKSQGGNVKYTITNACTFSKPLKTGDGVASGTDQKDRRLLTVAVVDCAGANGKFDAKIKQWIDVFLVEPSENRSGISSRNQIYGEIVGIAKRPDGGSAFQFYLRQRPRLIR
jgi:Flp pilus assembly protein TadG